MNALEQVRADELWEADQDARWWGYEGDDDNDGCDDDPADAVGEKCNAWSIYGHDCSLVANHEANHSDHRCGLPDDDGNACDAEWNEADEGMPARRPVSDVTVRSIEL